MLNADALAFVPQGAAPQVLCEETGSPRMNSADMCEDLQSTTAGEDTTPEDSPTIAAESAPMVEVSPYCSLLPDPATTWCPDPTAAWPWEASDRTWQPKGRTRLSEYALDDETIQALSKLQLQEGDDVNIDKGMTGNGLNPDDWKFTVLCPAQGDDGLSDLSGGSLSNCEGNPAQAAYASTSALARKLAPRPREILSQPLCPLVVCCKDSTGWLEPAAGKLTAGATSRKILVQCRQQSPDEVPETLLMKEIWDCIA